MWDVRGSGTISLAEGFVTDGIAERDKPLEDYPGENCGNLLESMQSHGQGR